MYIVDTLKIIPTIKIDSRGHPTIFDRHYDKHRHSSRVRVRLDGAIFYERSGDINELIAIHTRINNDNNINRI